MDKAGNAMDGSDPPGQDAGSMISRLGEIFSKLGMDPDHNINVIVRNTCGILNGVSSAYSRLDRESNRLVAISSFNLPSDYPVKDAPDGHICFEATMKTKDRAVVIDDIHASAMGKKYSVAKKYKMKSYIGFPVNIAGRVEGALCVVDDKPRLFSTADISVIGTLAKALSLEENRKSSLQALNETKARYKGIYKNTKEGIAVYQPSGCGTFFTLIAFNNAAEQIDRISKYRVRGKNLLEVFPEAEENGLLNALKKVNKNGNPIHLPFRFYKGLRINGWRKYDIYPLPSGEIVTVYSDDTPRKDAEINLVKSRTNYYNLYHLLRKITDIVPDLIWATDMENKYLFVNQATCDKLLMCQTPENAVGRTYAHFAKNEIRQGHRHTFKQMKNRPGSSTGPTKGKSIEYGLVRNKYMVLDVHKAPIFGKKGKRIGTVGSGRDVTKEKTIEAQLKKAYDDLENKVSQRTGKLVKANTLLKRENEERRAIQEKLIRSERLAATGQLAASIAHEINSPLQGIVALMSVMKQSFGDNRDLEQNLDLLRGAFESIRDTVKKLLDLNRPGKEKRQPVNVNTIIKDTVMLVRGHLKKNKTTVQLKLDPKMPETICSPQQMGQVFMNLINNAVESIIVKSDHLQGNPENNREIQITTFSGKGTIRIIVSDTGPGISPDDIKRIFDPFFTRKKTMGMGVGLSICHGIIEDHDGSIHAENLTNSGAAFTITLPVKTKPAYAPCSD